MIQKKKSSSWPKEEVKGRLNEFTKKELDRQFKPYAIEFLTAEKRWLLKQGEPIPKEAQVALNALETGKKSKEALLDMVAIPFLNSDCFSRFLTYLPDETQEILEHIALHGPMNYREVEKNFGIKAVVSRSEKRWHGNVKIISPISTLNFFSVKLPSEYSFYREDIIFYLKGAIRELIIKLLFPEPYMVQAYDQGKSKTKANEFLFEGESLIQQELQGILIRLRQKPLKLTQKGRPSIASIRSIRKKLKLQEFYPQTEQDALKYIRAKSLVGLLVLTDNLDPKEYPAFIKRLFNHEFMLDFHLPIHLMGYLGGINRLDPYHIINQGTLYIHLLQQMPVGDWFRYEDIELSLKTQMFYAYPVSDYGISQLRIEIPREGLRDYSREENISFDNEEKIILWPSFRAALFMLAAWGIIDIIYTEPDVSIISQTANSPYDGIKALRVNHLGAYVLGITDSYDSNVKPPFVLELAQDSLSILLIEGDHERAGLAIASFAKPLGNKRFYTNSELFLGDCKNSDELNHKIQLFTSLFSDKIPANWTQFFDEISQKVTPLEEEDEFLIFRIDPENRNLLQLIVRDPDLKKYCLKAEGYLILVHRKDVNKFKKRLQTFGYLLD